MKTEKTSRKSTVNLKSIRTSRFINRIIYIVDLAWKKFNWYTAFWISESLNWYFLLSKCLQYWNSIRWSFFSQFLETCWEIQAIIFWIFQWRFVRGGRVSSAVRERENRGQQKCKIPNLTSNQRYWIFRFSIVSIISRICLKTWIIPVSQVIWKKNEKQVTDMFY